MTRAVKRATPALGHQVARAQAISHPWTRSRNANIAKLPDLLAGKS
jgi:hypothetical protein